MKSVVILCLVVAAVHSADVDFRPKNRNARPSPVQYEQHQVKRQATVSGGRASVNSASFRQQTAPLQQAYRPQPSAGAGAGFRSSAQADAPQGASERAQQQQQSAQSAGFAPSAPGEQLFVPLRNAAPEAPIRPRQGAQRPSAAAALPSSAGRNPEYAAGFPEGFTAGLPAFDFQGRMPEPDSKSEGFMEGALNNFPSLKTFGGFDPLPDVVREENEPLSAQAPKRNAFVGGGRPSAGRPAQRRRRAAAAVEKVESNVTISSRAVVIDGDEALLELDDPVVEKSGRSSRKLPTDIQDIIADVTSTKDVDSVGQEQRFSPAFFPTNGPYGRFPAPAPAPAQQPPVPTGRSRRPVGPPTAVVPLKNRNVQRSPYADQLDFVDDNSLLGSGNFDVLGGGFFRDPGEYSRPVYNNYYAPAAPYVPPTRPSSGFFAAHQAPPSPPPSFQFHPIPAPAPPSPPQQQHHHHNDNYQTSFFDDDFFSNFRDFADVNQDYRN